MNSQSSINCFLSSAESRPGYTTELANLTYMSMRELFDIHDMVGLTTKIYDCQTKLA